MPLFSMGICQVQWREILRSIPWWAVGPGRVPGQPYIHHDECRDTQAGGMSLECLCLSLSLAICMTSRSAQLKGKSAWPMARTLHQEWRNWDSLGAWRVYFVLLKLSSPILKTRGEGDRSEREVPHKCDSLRCFPVSKIQARTLPVEGEMHSRWHYPSNWWEVHGGWHPQTLRDNSEQKILWVVGDGCGKHNLFPLPGCYVPSPFSN